jgi:hypothetical protein
MITPTNGDPVGFVLAFAFGFVVAMPEDITAGPSNGPWLTPP